MRISYYTNTCTSTERERERERERDHLSKCLIAHFILQLYKGKTTNNNNIL
ncbi:MAG: hypothetical protein K7J15_06495 [Candidatus Regiella insecticola]|nr:hypothetical protein [Candidatus Regiella insecticola]